MLLHKLSNLDIIYGVTGVTRTHSAFGGGVTILWGYQFSYRYKNKTSIKKESNMTQTTKSILSVSSRTVHKIIARAAIACSICNWNQATGDIHHIVEVAEGGSNDMSNLIYVCPNCHRCIHQLGDRFKTKTELYKLSLDKTFPNWMDYYNIVSTKKIKADADYTKKCLECQDLIPHQRKFCSSSCGAKYNNRKLKTSNKYSKEYIEEILIKYNGILTKCGAELNISDNAFKKHCIKYNIDPSQYRVIYKRSKTVTI